MRIPVGTVDTLWRYPVKSMLGETLSEAEIFANGILGDRAYALWDIQGQRVASAKGPQKWARLLTYQASFRENPTQVASLPPVTITFPDGRSLDSHQPEVSLILSQALGRDVEILSTAPVAASLDQYWPDVSGTTYQDKMTELFLPPGTFFDSCRIHLITTATLAQLQGLYPQGEFHPCRFRPNILINSGDQVSGFVENSWVGSILSIGETVRLKIDSACPRCVVTTLAQQGLPQDLEILRTTATHNNVIAGIRTSVLHGGRIQVGDPLILEDDLG